MDLDEGPDGMEEEIFEAEEKKTVSTRSRTRSRSRSRSVLFISVAEFCQCAWNIAELFVVYVKEAMVF